LCYLQAPFLFFCFKLLVGLSTRSFLLLAVWKNRVLPLNKIIFRLLHSAYNTFLFEHLCVQQFLHLSQLKIHQVDLRMIVVEVDLLDKLDSIRYFFVYILNRLNRHLNEAIQLAIYHFKLSGLSFAWTINLFAGSCYHHFLYFYNINWDKMSNHEQEEVSD
jgi:hypothetical protein